MSTDDNDYRRVTVGEVARRLDEQREDFKEFRREVLAAIHELQYVPRETYEANRAADIQRLVDVEIYVDNAQRKPERTLRELVTGLAYPMVGAAIGAVATIAAKAKGIA